MFNKKEVLNRKLTLKPYNQLFLKNGLKVSIVSSANLTSSFFAYYFPFGFNKPNTETKYSASKFVALAFLSFEYLLSESNLDLNYDNCYIGYYLENCYSSLFFYSKNQLEVKDIEYLTYIINQNEFDKDLNVLKEKALIRLSYVSSSKNINALYDNLFSKDDYPDFSLDYFKVLNELTLEDVKYFITNYIYLGYKEGVSLSNLNSSKITETLNKVDFKFNKFELLKKNTDNYNLIVNENSKKIYCAFKLENLDELKDIYEAKLLPLFDFTRLAFISDDSSFLNKKAFKNSISHLKESKFFYSYNDCFYLVEFAMKNNIDIDLLKNQLLKKRYNKKEFELLKKYLIEKINLKVNNIEYLFKFILELLFLKTDINSFYSSLVDLTYSEFNEFISKLLKEKLFFYGV